jgi:hypothetical protein
MEEVISLSVIAIVPFIYFYGGTIQWIDLVNDSHKNGDWYSVSGNHQCKDILFQFG